MPTLRSRPFLIFALAILLPGLGLGALALRSLQLQEAHSERERQRLLQTATDRLAQAIASRVDEIQRDFSLRVETLLGTDDPAVLATTFDERLRGNWPLAELGFSVSLAGILHAPQLVGPPSSHTFLQRNAAFLCQSNAAPVFATTPKGQLKIPAVGTPLENFAPVYQNNLGAIPQPRSVPAARFRDLVGDAQEGVLARFLDDDLVVWVWYRTPRSPELVFGAQLETVALRALLAAFVAEAPPPAPGIALALLNERGIPRATSPPNLSARVDWDHALASSFVGPNLPLWRMAAAPADIRAAHANQQRSSLVLASIVTLLVASLVTGGWLVVADARRQLALARQKSDFVSNVSHELRTPLTSIRLSAELLAENRVRDADRQARHLRIIQAEATRLQRLITNVLDFARAGRAPRTYRRTPLDLVQSARDVLESFAPQFQSIPFSTTLEAVESVLWVDADPDAVAQVLHNLVSNAVKYASAAGELHLCLLRQGDTACVAVLDRGPGVPHGLEERIFEPFFRVDDSLTHGIPGAGIGLSLARQTARDLGGDVRYHARTGGGSAFVFTLPAAPPPPRLPSLPA